MVHQNGKPGKPDEIDTNSDLKIVQHGKQQRATITVPLVVSQDDDLIKHINSVPPEERQRAIKNAMRGGMGYLAPTPEQSVDRSEEILEQLNFISQGVTWLMEQIENMPSWFVEQLRKISFRSVASNTEESIEENSDQLSEEDLAERRKNVKKRKW
jgi:type III secretory pathway component EscV